MLPPEQMRRLFRVLTDAGSRSLVWAEFEEGTHMEVQPLAGFAALPLPLRLGFGVALLPGRLSTHAVVQLPAACLCGLGAVCAAAVSVAGALPQAYDICRAQYWGAVRAFAENHILTGWRPPPAAVQNVPALLSIARPPVRSFLSLHSLHARFCTAHRAPPPPRPPACRARVALPCDLAQLLRPA